MWRSGAGLVCPHISQSFSEATLEEMDGFQLFLDEMGPLAEASSVKSIDRSFFFFYNLHMNIYGQN